MKLYEAVSKSYGAKFSITVGEETRELTLARMNANVMVDLETYDITVENFGVKLREKLATNATLVGWTLLEEKDEFNNDLTTFRKFMDIDTLAKLTEAIFEAFEDTKPEIKNEEGPVTQK